MQLFWTTLIRAGLFFNWFPSWLLVKVKFPQPLLLLRKISCLKFSFSEVELILHLLNPSYFQLRFVSSASDFFDFDHFWVSMMVVRILVLLALLVLSLVEFSILELGICIGNCYYLLLCHGALVFGVRC